MPKKITEKCLTRINLGMDTADQVTDILTDKELAQAIQKGLGKAAEPTRKKDMFLEAVINGYLSGFGTPIANAISILVQNVTAPTLELTGALTDALRITKGNRTVADAMAMFDAALEGFGADLMFLRQGWKSGYPLDINKSSAALARQLGVSSEDARKIIGKEIARAKAEKTFADPQNKSSLKDLQKAYEKEGFTPDEYETYIDEAYDYIAGHIPSKFGGDYIRWPTRATVAIDEYGKARFRRQKIAQMASIKAREDATGPNGIVDKALQKRLSKQYRKDALKIVDEGKAQDADEAFASMRKELGRVLGQDETAWVPVKDFALRQTFQSPLFGLIKNASDVRKESVLIAYFVPFIKTPWNIIKEGSSFIPGIGYALRPGYLKGATPVKMTNDELIPRQVLGASMFAGVISAYMSGSVTGSPRDANEAQAWKDQGIQPYSLKIGDTWVSYQRIEPIATVLGLAADLSNITNDFIEDPRPVNEKAGEYEKTLGPLLGALKSNLMSKTFMEGFSNIFEVMSDPERFGQSFMASAVRPLSPAFLNMVARGIDPYERLATNPLEKLQQRVPILREQLPQEFGTIGDARETNFVQAITGFGISRGPETPLQQELARLNFTKGRVGDTIQRVGLNTEQLASYRELSANILTPQLEALISSAAYQSVSDSRKKVILEKVTGRAQAQARKAYFNQLRSSDPEVAKKWYRELIISKGLQEDIPLE